MGILKKIIVLDLETTGSNVVNNEIIEIGAVKIEDGKIVETFNQLIRPKERIPQYVEDLTGITDEMVAKESHIENILPQFINFCDDYTIVGHNIILFDYRMLKAKSNEIGYSFEKNAIDTLIIARKCLADLPSRKLGDLCNYYGIKLTNAHRALDDAVATYELLKILVRDYYGLFPELFIPCKMAWKPPKKSVATSKQKKFLRYLLTTHRIGLDKDIEGLSKSEASKQIDEIIRKHGRISKL